MKRLFLTILLILITNFAIAGHIHSADDIWGIFSSSQIPSMNMIEFTENDSVSCAANDFRVYADLSEQKLKACQDGVVSDLLSAGAAGDSVSIDSAAVVDPDFVSTGQVDFVNTSNTVTANITNDSILEVDLKAVNSPTDEYVLTYEATTGDFEWEEDATGGGGGITVNSTTITGGTNTRVPFNDSGVYQEDSALTYNKTSNTLNTDYFIAAGHMVAPIYYSTAANPADGDASQGSAWPIRLGNLESILWEGNVTNGNDGEITFDDTDHFRFRGANGWDFIVEHSVQPDGIYLKDAAFGQVWSGWTNTYGYINETFGAVGNKHGGLTIVGLTDNVGAAALSLDAYNGHDAPVDPTMIIRVRKRNSGGSAVALATTEHAITFRNLNTDMVNMWGDGLLQVGRFGSLTNCSDSAGNAACSAAPAGSIVIDAADTDTVVSTTAVTADSQIFVQIDASLGTRLSVTCNTQAASVFNPRITARTAGTSFTITVDAGPTTNPLCLSYHIVN